VRKKFCSAALIAFCIFLVLFSEGFSQTNGEVRIVDAEGTSVITNDNIERARNNAIRDALQKAVEYVVLTLIPQNAAAEKSQVIREGIYAKYEDYIHDYRIVSERQADPHYKVSIKSKLSVGDIKDNLRILGILTVAVNGGPFVKAVIKVQGIESYADYEKIRELLVTRIRGVRNCHPQRMEHGMAKLIVTIQGGNIPSLTNELMKTGQFSLDTMSEERDYIAVTFLKHR
jgi:hypothetical protein